MTVAGRPESGPGGRDEPAATRTVRVRLFVHGGTISFSMAWSGTLTALGDHLSRDLLPRSGGFAVESPDRFIAVRHGSVSAYEFFWEPHGEGPLATIRPT
jgi:hypothetical protein